MSKNGLILLKPTSIAYTGTSATISANGSVEFSACTALSLNGVFSADYDNYTVAVRHLGSASNTELFFRLRASGSDAATGTNYTYQGLIAGSTTITGFRTGSANEYRFSTTSSTPRSGGIYNVYGPYLAQPTAVRSVTICGLDNARLEDYAGTHSLSTSYDGFTLFTGTFSGTASFSGRIAVYGMRK